MSKDLCVFIERLSELIEDKGINRHRLHVATGCDNHTIANWFSGRCFPKHSSLIALAEYFDCSIDFLLGISDDPKFYPSNKLSTFADRFKLCIEQNKLTEYRVAKLCGVEQSTISKWLLYGRMPDTGTLIKLARLFSCSVEFLLGRSEA